MSVVIVRAFVDLIGTQRTSTQQSSAPKNVDSQSTPPTWAWSSFGFGPSSQANGLYKNPQNRNAKGSVPNVFDIHSMPPPWAWLSLGVWDELASDQFFWEPQESPSKNFRHRKFLAAKQCRRHGHAHYSVLGQISQTICLHTNPQERHQKMFGSENF